MKISVHIKPNSRHREEVVKNDDDALTVYVKAPAIEVEPTRRLLNYWRNILVWRRQR